MHQRWRSEECCASIMHLSWQMDLQPIESVPTDIINSYGGMCCSIMYTVGNKSNDCSGKVFHPVMYASGYVRYACKGHEVGCLWFLVVKTKVGDDITDTNVPFQTNKSNE